MQKITPFLWFDGNAEEAVTHYVSIFKNSRVVNVSRQGERVLSLTFELEGQQFMALNGGPQFKFSEALSLFVSCETQAEVDELWARLGSGGQPGRCGWLKDKFGLSWQVTPRKLMQLMADPDKAKAARVAAAMMRMVKIDIAQIEAAAEGV